MKLIYKILIALFSLLILLIGGGYIYLNSAFPNVSPAPDMTVKMDSATIERGKYLANHVTICMDCHSTRDWSILTAPITPGTEGKGGERFTEQEAGTPGDFFSSNITPAGIGDYTDGELFRLITSGVKKDGEPIFPIMPYPSYSQMAPEDIEAIIAYIRTLHPIENSVPQSKAKFPVNLIMRTIPKDYGVTQKPDKNDKVAYGRYLTTIAACADCHTPSEKGTPIPGKEFAGGFEFKAPFGTSRSANITPDKETGIGNWTEDMFVKRFKAYDNPEALHVKVNHGEFQTVMPWIMYAGMDEDDLRAIYQYLRTIKPVKNTVVRFDPPMTAAK